MHSLGATPAPSCIMAHSAKTTSGVLRNERIDERPCLARELARRASAAR